MRGFDPLAPNLDLHQNYFIEASAGTGKTFTLESIVVRLVEEGIPIEQILVVTFTRAATSELKTRIRLRLESKHLHEAVRAFDEAKIFTIHGFCLATLKEFALETSFSLVQEEQSASPDLVRNILRDFLRTELSPRSLHPRQLEKAISKCRYDSALLFAALLRPAKKSIRPFEVIWEEIVQERERWHFKREELFEQLLSLAPSFSKMCDRSKNLKPDIIEGLERAAAFLAGESDDFFDLPLLHMVPANLLKTKGAYPPFLETLNHQLLPLLEEAHNLDGILDRLAASAQSYLKQVAKREDLFFFDDLLQTVQKHVRSPEFSARVRAPYRAVLIDEFQDTDPVQWEIFSTLFLHHVPLYLVGDPKQSIYRFRGADLYTYMEAKQQLGEEACVSLNRNFRSAPPLVEGLNALFARAPNLITLPKLGVTLPIPRVEPAASGEGGIISVEVPDEEALFNFVEAQIRKLHQEHKIPYNQCAVLVKDRYQAKRFCQSVSLPTAPRRSESLLESEAFSVLEDLILAAYHPRERTHVFKTLGGPLFHLSLQELALNWQAHFSPFLTYHMILKEEGILALFQAVMERSDPIDERLYLDMHQLVELLADERVPPERMHPFLKELQALPADSDRLKRRASSEKDAVEVMTLHMSKGLEFQAVFPIGLSVAFEAEDEEETSELMRLLYVGLTRAKNWLYLPLMAKAKSPLKLLFPQPEAGPPIPHLTLLKWEGVPLLEKSPPRAQRVTSIASPPLHLPLSRIHSYSSLAQKGEFLSSCPPLDGEIPGGPETGILIHKIFETLPFGGSQIALQEHVAFTLKGTFLEAYTIPVREMVESTLNMPLQGESPFCLSHLSSTLMIREMEFLYPSEEPSGYIKGFVDLFFQHDGFYYIVDWKSNSLPDYTPSTLQKVAEEMGYTLQAELYKKAAQNYLSLFGLEDKFKGSYFLFVRGSKYNQGTLFFTKD